LQAAYAAFRLPHETHAGAALNWLGHLQAHDSDRRGPWARWDGMSLEGKRYCYAAVATCWAA
jgi:hypothetical protein